MGRDGGRIAVTKSALEMSVVMPVYNASAFLEEAVESILDQTFRDFEFVVVDDGSTDDSPEMLKRVEDSRMRIITQKHAGVTCALNAGLHAARGAIIARMDADDISLPRRLERQSAYMKEHPDIAVVCVRDERTDENGKASPGQAFADDECWADPVLGLARRNFIVHGSVALRRDALEEIGTYNLRLEYAQDYDLWARMALAGKTFGRVDEVLYRRRTHAGAVSRRNARGQAKVSFAVQLRLIRHLARTRPQSLGMLLGVLDERLHRFVNEGWMACARRAARMQMRLEPGNSLHRKNYLLTFAGIRALRKLLKREDNR